MAENREKSKLDESDVRRIVQEMVTERNEMRLCFGFLILILYAFANFLVWNYGGVIGFFLNQPYDLWFKAVLQIQIILNSLFGLLILILIWSTK